MSRLCVIGVDLGGTNVRAGAFYEDGTPASPTFEHPSDAQSGQAATIAAIAAAISCAVEASAEPPTAVGMAVPGHIDDRKGMVWWSPNFGEEIDGVMHSWRNVALREGLAPLVGLPIFMGNDANLAALGEYVFGSGRNSAKCLVMLTIGTGIGGGVVLGPESVMGDARGPLLLVGGNGGGGELGHMIIQGGGLECNAGTYGAIEAHCQKESIIRRALNRILRGRETIIPSLVGGDLSEVTPLTLSEAAAQGDILALQVFQEVGYYLGLGIANCINVFAPDVVAIGGQIAKAGEWILSSARYSARDAAIPSLFADATIVTAERLEEAGMMGAVAYAAQRFRQEIGSNG